jgi:ribonuclease J
LSWVKSDVRDSASDYPRPRVPIHDGPLRIIPLGGLGEIGMNCLALEAGGDIVVIDCGVTFPSMDLGIDVLHPRFDYLVANKEKLRGVVITHGHEDHIGAIPYLCDLVRVPIHAPLHSLELIRRRLAEHDYDPAEIELRSVTVRTPFNLGVFGFEALRVTHSIADATALAIRTPAGLVVHTGDFKLDPAPTDGELTDEARLRELGDEGVRLLFSDSTGVDALGTSLSEEAVGDALDRAIAPLEGRAVVGMFASNVQRLGLLGRIARKHGRFICLLGRSAIEHARAAREVGRLDWPSDLVISPEIARELRRREVLVVATGTQAEPPAALARLAAGTHPKLHLDAGDTVIFSSRIIPGNDRQVVDLMGAFLRANIAVWGRANDPQIHASGHAHRDELVRMLELTRPASFIPVHGTRHHLERHAELARDTGVGDTLVIENGEVAELPREGTLSKVGTIDVGRVATYQLAPLADEVIRERTQIARTGVVFVSVVLSGQGDVMTRPALSQSGVIGPLDVDVLSLAARAAERGVRGIAEEEERRGDGAYADAARVAVRRTIETETGQRPVIHVSVQRVRGRGAREPGE